MSNIAKSLNLFWNMAIKPIKDKLPTSQSVTFAAEGWTEDTAGNAAYPYQYTLTVSGISASTRVDVVLDNASARLAGIAGVSPTVETAANAVALRSKTAPTAALTGTLYITK